MFKAVVGGGCLGESETVQWPGLGPQATLRGLRAEGSTVKVMGRESLWGERRKEAAHLPASSWWGKLAQEERPDWRVLPRGQER